MPANTSVDLRADIIDVRDLIERFEYIEDDDDESEEAGELASILDDLRGAGGGDELWRGDWYPITLIRDSYFTQYAQELAEDIGAVNVDATWPNNHIDWDAAADDLKQDYTTIEINGITYYTR